MVVVVVSVVAREYCYCLALELRGWTGKYKADGGVGVVEWLGWGGVVECECATKSPSVQGRQREGETLHVFQRVTCIGRTLPYSNPEFGGFPHLNN